jgi:hypothetical protein
MTRDVSQIGETFVKLALAISEHLPGYVDSYFGPSKWAEEVKQTGKLQFSELILRVDQLAEDIAQAEGMDPQRKDFLTRQTSAMQISLRLLAGENISLAEEVAGLYDVQPAWKDEAIFLEAHEQLNQILPKGGSLKERVESWNKSLEIPVEKVKQLLPLVIRRLRELTRAKFDLPEQESFTVEFVSDKPWGGYNWYLGEYTSRIDINTDLPAAISGLVGLIAHEAYPGHHTELSIKEAKLIRQRNYQEHMLTLINSPFCVIAEGIATTARKTILEDDELEDWYRDEILPQTGMTHIDASTMMEVGRVSQKLSGVDGNAAFMLHDQKKSADEVRSYLQTYGLNTEQEAEQGIKFFSNPLYRSYIFTYHVGRELLEELFHYVDRDSYFARLVEEPVTPTQVRQWIKNEASKA